LWWWWGGKLDRRDWGDLIAFSASNWGGSSAKPLFYFIL
jgi:hypothetical protein